MAEGSEEAPSSPIVIPNGGFRNQGYLIGLLILRESCYLELYEKGSLVLS